MKQAIAMTSACAIFLMPVHSAIAADSAAAAPTMATPLGAEPTPQTTPLTETASASLGSSVDTSTDPTATTKPALSATPLVTDVSTTPTASSAALDAQATISSSAGPPASVDASAISPAEPSAGISQISSNVAPPPGVGQVVSTLPAETAKELQEQALQGSHAGTISSHGEQPIAEGPEQCVTAGQCGNRNAIGFSMLAWGAALAGLIGLIVWIGKAGPDPCCGSNSSSCCCN